MSGFSKAVTKRRSRYSPEVLAKMQELGRLMGREIYGEDGPPIETTFSEIEDHNRTESNGAIERCHQ